jgi:serine/threonine-protein kinase
VPEVEAVQRSETHGTDLPPGTRVGEYEIEGKIGAGAMGAVYRAIHPAIGKHVAVKIMNPRLCGDAGAIERFAREARSVAAIRHPGIVDVFGFGALDDGRAYLIMEWLEGSSLASRLEERRLTPDEALDILDQIARALEAAHDKGIIHRDLKPDNIFLQQVARERPIIKIVDFGLAKLAFDEGPASVTQSGQLLGTPIYMSPEQCKGKGVDHRTDIYALGCVAYELICGRVPFQADNIAELIAAHLSEAPPLPRSLCADIPVQLDEVMFAMLAKEPSRRPSLQQVRQAIAEVRRSSAPVPWPSLAHGQWGTSGAGAWPTPLPQVYPSSLGGATAATPPVIPSMMSSATITKRRRRLAPTVVIAVASAAVAAVVVLAVTKNARRDRAGTAENVATGSPEVTESSTGSAVAPPVVVPDTTRASTPPVSQVPTPPPPSHETARPAAPNKPARATAADKPRNPPVEKVAVDSPVTAKEAVRSGGLSLSSTPPCDIHIDGKPTGLRTPQREIKLAAGHHVVTLVNSDHALAETFSVDIKPGSVVQQFKDYSNRPRDTQPDPNRQTINPFDKKRPP